MRALFLAGLCALVALPAHSQTGTLGGTIARDTVGSAIAQAEVQLPQLNRTAATNGHGEFQFNDVPAGRYLVTVRAIGFQPFADSVDVKAGTTIDADIMLTVMPVALPAAHTLGTVEKHLPFGLQEMEDRRKTHLGGFFVTDSALRANNDRKLPYMLAGVPGIQQVLGVTTSALYLANGRRDGKLSGGGDAPADRCYIDVFVDGARYFVGPATRDNPPPDFNAMWNAEYSGVEYYPSGATIPAQYNGTGSSSGVLLLWTRRTP